MLCVGAFLRFSDASREPLEFIEQLEFIPASKTLARDHLPIRVAQHGAVPVYLIRASTVLFGDSTIGARMLSVVAGTATILLLFLIGTRWWGPVAGLSAAAFLAVERYHITITRAIDLPFDLFFITVAVYCFSRFLHAAREDGTAPPGTGRWLYATAAASALGFLCKEFTALMLPAMFLGFFATGRAIWLRRREPWLATAVFLVLIAPDLYSNFTVTPEKRRDLYVRQENALRQMGIPGLDEDAVENGYYMSYGDQLSRFRGFGLDVEPFYFYFGPILERAGIPHRNEFAEFPYVHPALSLTLWTALAVTMMRRRKDPLTLFLLTMFAVMFVPFTLVKLGAPRAKFPTDPVALWYWVDRTMIPALLLTGQVIALAAGRFTRPAR